jgi:hypothetical protein
VTVPGRLSDGRRGEGVTDEPADLFGPVRDRFGLALGGNSCVESATAGQVDGLQRAVDRSADGGAVASLQPRR